VFSIVSIHDKTQHLNVWFLNHGVYQKMLGAFSTKWKSCLVKILNKIKVLKFKTKRKPGSVPHHM
jgi:hypothetical protein